MIQTTTTTRTRDINWSSYEFEVVVDDRGYLVEIQIDENGALFVLSVEDLSDDYVLAPKFRDEFAVSYRGEIYGELFPVHVPWNTPEQGYVLHINGAPIQ